MKIFLWAPVPALALVLSTLHLSVNAEDRGRVDMMSRADGCIGVNCGPDTPRPPTKPRQDGCSGINCGKDGPPPKPRPNPDGCIGINCNPK